MSPVKTNHKSGTKLTKYLKKDKYSAARPQTSS